MFTQIYIKSAKMRSFSTVLLKA